MNGLRPGMVFVSTDRGPHRERVTILAGEETELTFTVRPGIDINGIVVDTEGVAVAGATVILAGWAASGPRTIAKTDADGRFFLRQVWRMANVAARARGYAPSPFWSITAGAGTKVDVRIVLPGAGGSVHGQVLNPDGRGVADAVVKIGTMSPYGRVITLPDGAQGMHAPQPEVLTDAEGRFNADGLKPGASPVTVRTQAFAPWSGAVDVVAHMVMPMEIRLTRGVVCEGTVRDEKDKPLGGVDVQHHRYGSAEFRCTRTELDGSYRLDALPAGKSIKVRALSDKYGRATKEMQGHAGETLRWDVTLSLGLVLDGLVLGKDGRPLHNAMIQATGPVVKRRSTWGGFEVTDKEGRFKLVDCPTGPVIHLQLACRGYDDLHRMNVDATTGPIVLQMIWEGEPTARIIGTVIDPDGKPVGDAQLLVRRGSGRLDVHTTSAKGEIKIDKQRPGIYSLRIRARNFAGHVSEEHELASGETWDMGRVRLVHGGRLRLTLNPGSDREKERVYLSVYRLNGRFLSGFNTSRRPLVSDPLAPGRYHLKVAGPTVVPETIPFRIREGSESKLEVTPRFGLARTLEFVLPEGTDEVRRMTVTMTGGDGFKYERLLARWRRSPFDLKIGLCPGHYTVRAQTEKGHRGQLEFDVTDASTESQTIRVNMR